eukprot:g28195.t1
MEQDAGWTELDEKRKTPTYAASIDSDASWSRIAPGYNDSTMPMPAPEVETVEPETDRPVPASEATRSFASPRVGPEGRTDDKKPPLPRTKPAREQGIRVRVENLPFDMSLDEFKTTGCDFGEVIEAKLWKVKDGSKTGPDA